MSVSAVLGDRRIAQTPAGSIEYRERGSGSPVVFVHGVGVNGDLWRHVAPRLADEHRCIVPDLPWGAHSHPLREDADLSLPGMARIVADFMAALELDDVTIVANDTGGAFAQSLAGRHPGHIGRLVLTSCDAFEKFPPTPQRYLAFTARSRALMWFVAWSVQFKFVQRLPTAYGWTTTRPIEPAIMRSYTAPVRTDPGVRRDLTRLLRAVDTRFTHEAAEALRGFDRPASSCGPTATRSSRANTDADSPSCCPTVASSSCRTRARSSPRSSRSTSPRGCATSRPSATTAEPHARLRRSGVDQALRHAIEEARPPFPRALVLLRRHASALLKEHLGPAFAEVREDDDHQLVRVLPGLVGDGEHEALGLDHLAVFALPLNLAAPRAGQHRRPPRSALPDVHRDRGHGHLGVAAAVPVREALGLGPLLPHLLPPRVEHAGDRQPLLGPRVGRGRLSHSRFPSRSIAGAPRGGRSSRPRTHGSSRANPRRP